MADIFVSYSQKDRKWVKRLVDALTAEGWEVWWDLEIRAGEPFDRAIERTLPRVRCVVTVWSQHARDSDWVRAEAAWAKKHKKLVSIRIQDELDLPIEFYHIHTDNFTDWDGSSDSAEFRKLVEDIGALAPISASKREPEPRPDVRPKPEPGKAESEPAQEQVSKPAFLKRRGVFVGVLSLAVVALVGGALYFGILHKTDVDSESESSTASQEADTTEPSFGMKEIIMLDESKVEPVEVEKTTPVPQKAESQRDSEPPKVFREPDMLVIPAGQFEMGCASGKECKDHWIPVRTVTFDKPFAVGKYEVTFEEYDRFAKATGREKPYDNGWGRGSRPVIYVSWDDAVAYAEWFSQETGKRYRLPSEAEWEYAARAGTETRWSFGNEERGLGKYAWYSGNSGGKTHPVGEKEPNSWGLHDVHGNVWERVQDCWNDSYKGAPTNGEAWESGECNRVIRGGSWFNAPRDVRSATRIRDYPANRYGNVGFRLAQDL